MKRALSFILCSCWSGAPIVAQALPGDEHAGLVESTRPQIAAACAPCHVRSDPDAKPEALAVFDLEEASWSRRMSASQLRAFPGRLGRKLEEPERLLVMRLLGAEMALRGEP
jgi:hypothetical protein